LGFQARRLSGDSRKIFSRLLWRVAFAQVGSGLIRLACNGAAGRIARPRWTLVSRTTRSHSGSIASSSPVSAHHSVPRLLCSLINRRDYLFRLFKHRETAMFRTHEGGDCLFASSTAGNANARSTPKNRADCNMCVSTASSFGLPSREALKSTPKGA
jgi:hypothetical protein